MARSPVVAHDADRMIALMTRLRRTSLIEAVSYLLLLLVGMPLKYMAGMPLAVQIIGMVHGVLFLILVWCLVRMSIESNWPKSRIWLLATASIVPVMPFFLDPHVRRWIREPSVTE